MCGFVAVVHLIVGVTFSLFLFHRSNVIGPKKKSCSSHMYTQNKAYKTVS